jgi:hypothetical protein
MAQFQCWSVCLRVDAEEDAMRTQRSSAGVAVCLLLLWACGGDSERSIDVWDGSYPRGDFRIVMADSTLKIVGFDCEFVLAECVATGTPSCTILSDVFDLETEIGGDGTFAITTDDLDISGTLDRGGGTGAGTLLHTAHSVMGSAECDCSHEGPWSAVFAETVLCPTSGTTCTSPAECGVGETCSICGYCETPEAQ